MQIKRVTFLLIWHDKAAIMCDLRVLIVWNSINLNLFIKRWHPGLTGTIANWHMSTSRRPVCCLFGFCWTHWSLESPHLDCVSQQPDFEPNFLTFSPTQSILHTSCGSSFTLSILSSCVHNQYSSHSAFYEYNVPLEDNAKKYIAYLPMSSADAYRPLQQWQLCFSSLSDRWWAVGSVDSPDSLTPGTRLLIWGRLWFLLKSFSHSADSRCPSCSVCVWAQTPLWHHYSLE